MTASLSVQMFLLASGRSLVLTPHSDTLSFCQFIKLFLLILWFPYRVALVSLSLSLVGKVPGPQSAFTEHVSKGPYQEGKVGPHPRILLWFSQ